MNIIALIDPGLRHDAIGVGAVGGLDVVLACCENSRERLGGGDVLGSNEQCIMIGIG